MTTMRTMPINPPRLNARSQDGGGTSRAGLALFEPRCWPFFAFAASFSLAARSSPVSTGTSFPSSS